METDQKEDTTVNIKPSFGNEIDIYIKHLDSLVEIVPLIMELVSIKLVQESRHIDQFLKEQKFNEEENSVEGEETNILIPEEELNKFISLTEKLEASEIAYKFLPINFIVSFISQYDAYLGGLIRTIFLVKPELLNSSEKNLTFSELLNFDSIEDAREFVIEKEVESVLRESHLKQFKWLEGKLSMKLREGLPSFKDFMEITERRNLFVHCNGVVSRQYIQSCKENGIENVDNINVGDKLAADPSYFVKCYQILYEIGVKLGHVLWRKLQPNDIENADKHLIDISYQLLLKGHYKLSLNLLNFATDVLKKHHDQETTCIYQINKSLAFYLSGKKAEAIKVIDKHDWSATSDKYKLATVVLKEDYERAGNLMLNIGPSNDHITKSSYREWPLFKEFRKTEIFKDKFHNIFGEEFAYVEPKPKKLTDVLEEIKELKKQLEESKENIEDIEPIG
ncbi:hypothetical protein [Pontibacter virosus]|uniref:Uncharacterized protein n=1 Tax=Pontibacter virosus TaxID=1765052 RepID=A0A2U1ATY7_9BACT|nr:hypothetical protein [Pontibacter virosus]PVY39886.1 hypothetical protein C8E01_10930 [Pontibacter virosus]